MRARVFGIGGPVTVWALHFIAMYALISAACAPRSLLEPDALRIAAFIATAAAVVPVVAWLARAFFVLRHEDPNGERSLALAAAWSAGISLMAIIASLWPVIGLASCTG